MTDRVRDGLGHEYAAAFLEHAVLEHCIASNTFCVAFRMRDGVHTGIPSRAGWQLLTFFPSHGVLSTGAYIRCYQASFFRGSS